MWNSMPGHYYYFLGVGLIVGFVLVALEITFFFYAKKKNAPTWYTFGHVTCGRWGAVLIALCGIQFFVKMLFPPKDPLLDLTSVRIANTIYKSLEDRFRYTNYESEIRFTGEETNNGCLIADEILEYDVLNTSDEKLFFFISSTYTNFEDYCERAADVKFHVKFDNRQKDTTFGPYTITDGAKGQTSKKDSIIVMPKKSISVRKTAKLYFGKTSHISKTVARPADIFEMVVSVPRGYKPEPHITHPLSKSMPDSIWFDYLDEDSTMVKIYINTGLLSSMGADISWRPIDSTTQ